MVWFARLLGLDHCLLSPPGGGKCPASVLFHHPAKGARESWVSEVQAEGAVPRGQSSMVPSVRVCIVSLCEAMSGGKQKQIFFCFFVC